MALNIQLIGDRIVDEIERLAAGITELTSSSVALAATTPTIQLRKRRSGRGRELSTFRVNEGITVTPVGPRPLGGTNDRDDIGYQYVVWIVSGTLSDDIEADWWIGLWEQAIRRRFHMKRVGDRDIGDDLVELSNSSFCEISCTVRTREMPRWADLDDGLDYTALEVTVFVRESR